MRFLHAICNLFDPARVLVTARTDLATDSEPLRTQCGLVLILNSK